MHRYIAANLTLSLCHLHKNHQWYSTLILKQALHQRPSCSHRERELMSPGHYIMAVLKASDVLHINSLGFNSKLHLFSPLISPPPQSHSFTAITRYSPFTIPSPDFHYLLYDSRINQVPKHHLLCCCN